VSNLVNLKKGTMLLEIQGIDKNMAVALFEKIKRFDPIPFARTFNTAKSCLCNSIPNFRPVMCSDISKTVKSVQSFA
jgi:hypothetical protein